MKEFPYKVQIIRTSESCESTTTFGRETLTEALELAHELAVANSLTRGIDPYFKWTSLPGEGRDTVELYVLGGRWDLLCDADAAAVSTAKPRW